MSEIRFYHLLTRPVDQALPAILTKASSTGQRILVRVPDKDAVRHFDEWLWAFSPDSFLPHGVEGGSRAASEPILLSDRPDGNSNDASILMLVGQTEPPADIAQFILCCDFLDGRDELAVSAARERWKAYKSGGHSMIYYQQNESGGWDQRG